MNPERLAMLAPKSLDMLSSHGGVASVTPEDIAAAMHSLDELEWELLTVKYCGGKPHKLYALVFAELKSDEQSQRVIVDAVGQNICPRCKGVKQLVVASKTIVCEFCAGSGRYYLSSGDVDEWALRWLQQVEAVALSKVQGVDGCE